jgi:hypothetical protein
MIMYWKPVESKSSQKLKLKSVSGMTLSAINRPLAPLKSTALPITPVVIDGVP